MLKVTDNVTLLGNGYFNFYLVGRQEAALVECGTRAAAAIFARQWEELKDKPDVRYIVAMHSHFDHSCGIPVLKQIFPDAQVVASAMAQKIMGKEKIVQDLFLNDEVVSDNYLKNNFISEKPDIAAPSTMAVDCVVAEGESLTLGGGLQLKILDAPGHSVCSIGAYLKEDQFMFVSDSLGYRFQNGEVTPTFFAGFSPYIATIEKFMTYPTRAVGPAHGAVAIGDEALQLYQKALRESQQAFEYIKEKISQGVEEKALARELFQTYIKEGLAWYPVDMMMGAMFLLIKSVKAEM